MVFVYLLTEAKPTAKPVKTPPLTLFRLPLFFQLNASMLGVQLPLYGRIYLMRIPRIYHPQAITQLGNLTLSEDAAGHVGRVLRMKAGHDILLFDGLGA